MQRLLHVSGGWRRDNPTFGGYGGVGISLSGFVAFELSHEFSGVFASGFDLGECGVGVLARGDGFGESASEASEGVGA